MAFAGLAAVSDANVGAVDDGNNEPQISASFASRFAVGEHAIRDANAVVDAHFAASGVALGVVGAVELGAG